MKIHNGELKTYKHNVTGRIVVARDSDIDDTFLVTVTEENKDTRQYVISSEEFSKHYSTTEEDLLLFDFSFALMGLKNHKRVTREGWNGKDQWVVLINPGNAMHTSVAGSFDMQPCFGLKNAQNKMQPGWLPSIGDLLATDWMFCKD